MKKHDYAALDCEILKAIESGKRFFEDIACTDVMQEAKKLEASRNGDLSPGHFYFTPAWRYIDARLQVLRKSGKIEWLGANGWCPVKKQGEAL